MAKIGARIQIDLTIDCDFIAGSSLKADAMSKINPEYPTKPYTISSITDTSDNTLF